MSLDARILVVDDDRSQREELAGFLRDIGAVVTEAGDGREALDAVVRQAPDLCISDVRMPGMNGLEVAHHLQQLENPPAIIFTTAYDEYALKAFDASAIGYLLKPVRRERLRDALESARRLTRPQISELRNTDSRGTRSQLCVRKGGQLELIPLADVSYFHADHKYVRKLQTLGSVQGH